MIELNTIIFLLVLLISMAIAYIVGNKFGTYKANKEWETNLPEYRKDAIMRSRSVLSGNFSEQISPYLPGFKYSPSECKFIGKPIDFIVFKGMDEKKIDEVVFVEVKSGNAKLSLQEKNLKEAIKNKRVKFEEYRVPEDITRKRDDEDDNIK